MNTPSDPLTQQPSRQEIMRDLVVVTGHGENWIGPSVEEVCAVMEQPGGGILCTATACGPERMRIAAEKAMNSAPLENIDLATPKDVLVLILVRKDGAKLAEAGKALCVIQAQAPRARIDFCWYNDDAPGDEARVSVWVSLARSATPDEHISVSQVQRRLGIGYNAALHLARQMRERSRSEY
jgi:cell division GTPase FtsZ